MRTHRIVPALFASCVVAIALCTLALDARAAAPSSPPQDKHDQQARPQPSSDGERIFQQNCSRCHHAPEGFSPSISGTIVRHMRVRANLSREDERAILKYLNP